MSEVSVLLERSRYDDLVADIVARVRQRTPGLTDEQVAELDAEIRRDWGGVQLKVRRVSAIERARLKELIARGVPERSARRKVRGG